MENHEEVYLILLNQASKILGVVLVSKGSVNKAVVDIKLYSRNTLIKQTPY